MGKHRPEDGIWGRGPGGVCTCAPGLQLSCCACPDADAVLQMGDCEPVGDRMASRGPRQDSNVDPRGVSELNGDSTEANLNLEAGVV